MVARFAAEVVTDTAQLLGLADAISSLADGERLSLGFWPKAAIHEAISRKTIIALVVKQSGESTLLGYIHYSGTYPHAKVQQVAVRREFRKNGYASTLLNVLVSNLEKQGYLSIRADIAEDLQESLAFYRANGFVHVFSKLGGKSRKRQILVHDRALDTDDLFSVSERTSAIDLGIRRRSAGDRPIYAIDLNVFFDLVRDRSNSDFARKIFGSALAHEVRLAVAAEFSKELQRTSAGPMDDPLLQMALRLPTLPKVDDKKHHAIADYIHDIVFVRTGNKAAGTAQAISDARHVAHAALARASGFVTRDGALLESRTKLLEALGIDIIDTNELADLLPRGLLSQNAHPIGQGFSAKPLSQEELVNFLRSAGVDPIAYADFRADLWVRDTFFSEGIFVDGQIVAAGAAKCPSDTLRSSTFIMFVQPSYPKAALLCDFLLDRMVTEISAGRPVAIQLAKLPGQSVVGSVARAKGFARSRRGEFYEKFALGHPLTFANWTASANELRRCTGLIIPTTMRSWSPLDEHPVQYPSGETVRLTLNQIEALLGPTVLVAPEQCGVLVPIGRAYADELLGTGNQSQFSFVENRDASFRSRRGYVSSPHRAALFQADTPILFYESKGTGGRGAVVALAKIADSLIVRKDQLSTPLRNELVVDDVTQFSSTDNVLVTSFYNLMRAPKSISLRRLREIEAVDGANLVSAKAITAQHIREIVHTGWDAVA